MNARSTALAERPAEIVQDMLPQSRGPATVIALPRATEYPPKIAAALMAITREFGHIPKGADKEDPNGGWNDFHKYGYQKWEDVLNRESELFAEKGIILQQSETAKTLLDKLISISYEFTIINEHGEVWPDRPVFSAIARLIDHKGMFDDKAANKCHTQAHKYFLLHFFKIKTREAVTVDADAGEQIEGTAIEQGQPKKLKPPKPTGAASAPPPVSYKVSTDGKNIETWTTAFIAAIDADPAHVDDYFTANPKALQSAYQYPEVKQKIAEAALRAKNPTTKTTKPKPPKPGTPKTDAVPSPQENGPAWIEWLTAQMDDFDTYEKGEAWWNDKIAPVIDDLPQETRDDAMGLWRKFEQRFES